MADTIGSFATLFSADAGNAELEISRYGKSIGKVIDDLQRAVGTVGLTARGVELYSAAVKGATQTELEHIQALQRVLELKTAIQEKDERNAALVSRSEQVAGFMRTRHLDEGDPWEQMRRQKLGEGFSFLQAESFTLQQRLQAEQRRIETKPVGHIVQFLRETNAEADRSRAALERVGHEGDKLTRERQAAQTQRVQAFLRDATPEADQARAALERVGLAGDADRLAQQHEANTRRQLASDRDVQRQVRRNNEERQIAIRIGREMMTGEQYLAERTEHLNLALRRGTITLDQYQRGLQRAQMTARQMESSLHSSSRGGQIGQQLAFGLEDFVVSAQTGGIAGGIRGAMNNLSFAASMLGGQFALWGTAIGTATVAMTSLYETLTKSREQAELLANTWRFIAEQDQRMGQHWETVQRFQFALAHEQGGMDAFQRHEDQLALEREIVKMRWAGAERRQLEFLLEEKFERNKSWLLRDADKLRLSIEGQLQAYEDAARAHQDMDWITEQQRILQANRPKFEQNQRFKDAEEEANEIDRNNQKFIRKREEIERIREAREDRQQRSILEAAGGGDREQNQRVRMLAEHEARQNQIRKDFADAPDQREMLLRLNEDRFQAEFRKTVQPEEQRRNPAVLANTSDAVQMSRDAFREQQGQRNLQERMLVELTRSREALEESKRLLEKVQPLGEFKF